MRDERYDVVIIGSGAGGGTMAHALRGTSARVLVLERGDFVQQEEENWSPKAVWKDRRYRAKELWVDADGREFPPYTHYCVGGNTKFWGSVLYRLRREDFQAVEHVDGISPAWPIDYDTLAPYYQRAEALYHVRGKDGEDPSEPPREPFPYAAVPHEDRIARIVDQLKRLGLHPSTLPLGLIRPREAGGCVLCKTCNSFPCKVGAKSDADVCCLRPAVQQPSNVHLWRNAYAERLTTDASGERVTEVVVRKDGEACRVKASLFIVSCGAVNSAALLLRSANAAHPNGLANSSGLVGRRYMAHLATMISAVRPLRWNRTSFQKTVAINDFYFKGPRGHYPLGQIQSQGRIHPIMIQAGAPPELLGMARRIPLWFYTLFWVLWSVEWLAMTEDLPQEDNRVTVDSNGQIHLHYRPSNLTAHRELVDEVRLMLRTLGYRFVTPVSLGLSNTTHQCGTVVFGTDPRRSVLDPYCRAHDVGNLFVVDASFFPSSAAVNPGLTIAAQALRVADHITASHLA